MVPTRYVDTMHPPLLVVGHDELQLQATRDALLFGRLLNPVVACTDVAEATSYAQEHPAPAVVLTELTLPDGGAADILGLISGHAFLSGTPVIVVSEDATEDAIAEVHQLGAAAYLDRSLAVDVLVDVIRDTGIPWAFGTRAEVRPGLRLLDCDP